MPKPQLRQVFLNHGRVFVEVPQLMTDDELVAVFEDFIAEVRKRRLKRRPNRRNRQKAALYPRIGTQRSADSGLRCLSVSNRTARTVDLGYRAGPPTAPPLTAQMGGPRHRPRAGALTDDAAEIISLFHGKNTRPACGGGGRLK
jgi:hypothetical protein